jgi:spore coat-associated protein N
MTGDALRHRGAAGRGLLGNKRKALLSVAALGASTAVMVTGTYAAFTASASRGHQVTTGVPVLTLGTVGTVANRLGVDAIGLAPGSAVYRTFDLSNTGTTNFTTLTATTEVTTSSILDTDTVNGLQAQLESCSVAWTESGTTPNYTYSCSGTRKTVFALRPVTMSNVPLTGLASLNGSGTDHLMVTEQLPVTADNSFINKMTALTYTFVAS